MTRKRRSKRVTRPTVQQKGGIPIIPRVASLATGGAGTLLSKIFK